MGFLWPGEGGWRHLERWFGDRQRGGGFAEMGDDLGGFTGELREEKLVAGVRLVIREDFVHEQDGVLLLFAGLMGLFLYFMRHTLIVMSRLI